MNARSLALITLSALATPALAQHGAPGGMSMGHSGGFSHSASAPATSFRSPGASSSSLHASPAHSGFTGSFTGSIGARPPFPSSPPPVSRGVRFGSGQPRFFTGNTGIPGNHRPYGYGDNNNGYGRGDHDRDHRRDDGYPAYGYGYGFGFPVFGYPLDAGLGYSAYTGNDYGDNPQNYSDYPQNGAAAQQAPEPDGGYAAPGEPGPGAGGNYAPRPAYVSPGQPAQPAPAQPAPAQAAPDQPVTTLVFQDGRAPEKVHNYLLTPTRLVVLDGVRHEIALRDLDLPRTVATNDASGVPFVVPSR